MIEVRGDDMVENLKKLRNQKGVSQQKLADTIEVSQQSINMKITR